ncbi:HET-domain-containing protein, partial [Lophium mytilinum]
MAFEYEPLSSGEYRVLILFPASWSQQLLCALVSGPPHSLPKYEAVSYTWGQPDRTHPVLCNNATKTLNGPDDLDIDTSLRFERVIYVTENLKTLLHRFRHENESRYLWIDSICINQNDLSERAAQVQMMMTIYHLSQRVNIWLGEEDEYTEPAFGLLGHLLLRRPWFKRLWVIQEVVVSKQATVICGNRSVDWNHLFDACQVLEKRDLFFDDVLGRPYISVISMGILRLAYHVLHSTVENEDAPSTLALPEVILRTMNAESSDPRDKVYALLGMIREQDRQNLRPDYTKSVRDVYIQMARQLCLFNGKPCFTFIGIISQKTATHRLPSWVPDWSVSHQAIDPIARYGRFQASKDSALCMEFPREDEITDTRCCLKVRGVCLLTIGTIQHPSPGKSPDRDDHCATLNSYRDPYPTTSETY